MLNRLTISSGENISGGGIYNIGGGTVTLNDRSSVSRNTASRDGGGIYNIGFGRARFGMVTLNAGSSVGGNTASRDGGGIYNIGGTLTVIKSVVSGNTAGQGGGINNRADATLRGSIVKNNKADAGGGIANLGPQASLTLTASEVLRNTTFGEGGGIVQAISAGPAVIRKSLVFNNHR